LPVPTVEYVAGMRRLAAGVSIVAARCDGVPAGLTATAVCSLTAEPPRLLACIHREADTHAAIVGSGLFTINLLTETHLALADRFGGREDVFGPARFALGSWRDGVTGMPVLADAAAVFECRVVDAIAAGTHEIFIGEVEAVALGTDAAPLLYWDRGYGRLAPLGG
jgi:flavin reductase (DIM6/NTAB) family NADH-FMN oxidoreductase RutF